MTTYTPTQPVALAQVQIAPPAGNLFRVLHDWELWKLGLLEDGKHWDWRAGYPEVFILQATHVVKMDVELQHLMYDLFTAGTPSMKETTRKGKWRSLYQYDRAFTNGTGFNDDSDPRADYINMQDLEYELPKLDKTRVCGGATVRGEVDGDWVWVETIQADSLPTIGYVLGRPWLYFHATTSRDASGEPAVGRFPQGDGEPCFVPLVSRYPVRYPLAHLQPVDEIADPYRFYL